MQKLVLALPLCAASIIHYTQAPAPYQPPKPNATIERTLSSDYGSIIDSNANSSTLLLPDGRIFKVRPMPIGNYRDIKIINGRLQSATVIPIKPDCDSFLSKLNTTQVNITHCL